MEKELCLVFVFVSILNQQIHAQKVHFCNITESYFVEVTKTETIKETKKPSGFNLLGVLFGGSSSTKYENVTKHIQGVEKKERVVEVCCKGYKPKGSECVPMDESKAETKTTTISKPSTGTVSSSISETTTPLHISSITTVEPLPPENQAITTVPKTEIVTPSLEPITVEKVITTVPSIEIITPFTEKVTAEKVFVTVPSTENVALSKEPVQTTSSEPIISKIVPPTETSIPSTESPETNPPEPIIATNSPKNNIEMESATTTLIITEIIIQNTATNLPPVIIENVKVNNEPNTMMINENTYTFTETATQSVNDNTEIISEYTRKRRHAHIFTENLDPERLPDSNSHIIKEEQNTFKSKAPITLEQNERQILSDDLIDQGIREEVEVKTLELEENYWVEILEMFSFGAIIFILGIAVQTAYNNKEFISSWKVRNDVEDSEYGTQFEYISHIFIEEV